MGVYFRIQTADRDTSELLEPAEQHSRAWQKEELVQDGVSACESREELAYYLATKGAGIPYGTGDWVVVELDGQRLMADGHDADCGEVLIRPTHIRSVVPMDDAGMFDLIGDVLDELEAA